MVLGTSGDTGAEAQARDAGADGFLAKPITSLATFQEAILAHLPADRRPVGLRTLSEEEVQPDPIAYRDDMAHVADMLEEASDARTVDYLAQFVSGVARSAEDKDLAMAAEALVAKRARGDGAASEMARIAGLVQDRLSEKVAI